MADIEQRLRDLEDEAIQLRQRLTERDAARYRVLAEHLGPAKVQEILEQVSDKDQRRACDLDGGDDSETEKPRRSARVVRNPRTVQCPYCEKKVASQERLGVHIRREHPDRAAAES